MKPVVDVVIERDEVVGEGGFLAVRRLGLRNRREDGTVSEPYVCDFLVRPKGLDAVIVVLYRQTDSGVEVLLRDGLRPALSLGRSAELAPIADGKMSLFMSEVVAGIIEAGDEGESGVRKRAAIEVHEEGGYRVSPDDIEFLGAGSYPSPGAMPEKFWLMAVEIPADATQEPLPGDGSPMEEGATTRWVTLAQAISDCVSGRLEDLKTEVVLRRLRDRLASSP